MAVDEELNERVRKILDRHADIAEKRMFSGTCFMLNGNMLCAASQKRMMFRVGKEQDAEAMKRLGAKPMIMSGRRMAGFVFVDRAHCDARALKSWIALAEKFVSTLPAKKARRGRAPVI